MAMDKPSLVLLIALFLVFFLYKQVKAMPSWTGIVIHHSDTLSGTVESIRRYHIEVKGWDDIGYHYVIYLDGSVNYGRLLNKVGAHAYGRNRTHIGICLIGKQTFTNAQFLSVRTLCHQLLDRFPIKTIERHHEECPGTGINVEQIEKDVLSKRGWVK